MVWVAELDWMNAMADHCFVQMASFQSSKLPDLQKVVRIASRWVWAVPLLGSAVGGHSVVVDLESMTAVGG